jgi:hypothetical protein
MAYPVTSYRRIGSYVHRVSFSLPNIPLHVHVEFLCLGMKIHIWVQSAFVNVNVATQDDQTSLRQNAQNVAQPILL